MRSAPFEEVTRLTGPCDQETVSLARCRACRGTFLYYATLVQDEHWQYWCPIDPAERDLLLEEDDLWDPQRSIHARALLEKHGYLLFGPARKFEWMAPGQAVAEGTPW